MNQPTQIAGRRRAGILDALQGGLRQPMPPSISIRNAMFALVDAAGNEIPLQLFDPQYGRYIDVVIIGVNPKKSREYYDKPYDPTVPMAPACFSDNGFAPSASAEIPQHPTCDMCPQAMWGSKISAKSGKGIPACSTKKKLAVLVCNDPSQIAFQFKIPPASLKNITELAQMLAKHQMPDEERPGMMRSADPADVVTRVYFDLANQGELLFQPIGYHAQMYPYITQLIEHIDSIGSIDVLTGVNDVPYTGAIALPNPGVQQQALPAPAMQTQAPPPNPATMGGSQFQQPVQQPPAAMQPGFAPQQSQFQQPVQQAPQQPAPAPRTRRGGARVGAGRPAQQGAPQQAPQPQPTPFQQQGGSQPAPFGAPNAVPFGNTTGPTASPAATTSPSNAASQLVPFQPQAAPAFTGPVPQQAPMVPNDPGPMPAFLDRTQGGGFPAPQPQFQQPVGVAPGNPGGGPAFGMTNGAQPDPALSQALQNAFGAPMQPRQR